LILFAFKRENKKEIRKFRIKEKPDICLASSLPEPFGPLGLASRVRPLSLCEVGPSCRRRFPLARAPRSPSAQRAPPISAVTRSLHSLSLSLSLSAPWDRPVSSVPPRTAADPRMHTENPGHVPQLPLSPARTRSLSPASFRPLSPSLTLCHHRHSSLEESTRRADHPEHQTSCRVFPSAVPR
jgi:hypothetical protein